MMRKAILIWLILTVLVLAFTIRNASQDAVICWDGIEVDEPLLMELCGITEEEYFGSDFIPEDCPEAWDAIRMVGGCETDWPSAISLTVMVMIVYFVISGVGFFILWLVRRRKSD
jgi:hypothetical protein